MTGFLCDDGPIIVIGCQNDWRGWPPAKMREVVALKYPPDHEYFAAIALAEKYLAAALARGE